MTKSEEKMIDFLSSWIKEVHIEDEKRRKAYYAEEKETSEAFQAFDKESKIKDWARGPFHFFEAGAKWKQQQLQAENARLRDVLNAAMENIRNADYAVALEKIKHALEQ